MAHRKGPRKVNTKKFKKLKPEYSQTDQAATNVASQSGWVQVVLCILGSFLLVLYGDSIQPVACSLLWTLMAVVFDTLQAFGLIVMMLQMAPDWVSKLAAYSLKLCLAGSAVWVAQQFCPSASIFGRLRVTKAPTYHEAATEADSVPSHADTAEHVLEGKAGASAINNPLKSPFPSSSVGGGTSRVATTTPTSLDTSYLPEASKALNKRERRAAQKALKAKQLEQDTTTVLKNRDNGLIKSASSVGWGANTTGFESSQVPRNSKLGTAPQRAATHKQAAEDRSAGAHASSTPPGHHAVKSAQGGNKGVGSTSSFSGATKKSPEGPKTPPQATPGKVRRSTLVYTTTTPSMPTLSMPTAASTKEGGNTKSKPHARTNNTYASTMKKSQYKFTSAVPSAATAGKNGHASGPNPLVGQRVDFRHKINYYSDQNCPMIANKLKQLPHFSGWRSVRGDGNCAYRSILVGLLEAAAAADDYTRQALVQQIEKLYKGLPEWARSSFSANCNVAFGYGLLKMLISNSQGMSSVGDMAAVCCRQMESDSMLLFLRAVTAAGMASDELMELWADPIREKLPASYRGWSLAQMVRSCVLPLAGSKEHVLWKWRHGGHAELGVLANALGLHVNIHDVETKVFVVSLGPDQSRVNVSLLSTGAHFELVFE